jgi:DNA-binding MarR family transcriptional regulator
MERDELSLVATEIRILTTIVAKLAKRDLEFRLQSCDLDLGALSYGVMRLLSCHEQTISELSRQMQLAPATLVPVVDALERDGLITRGQDPRDRRRVPLSLTERGATILDRVPFIDQDDSLVSSLSTMGDEPCRHLLSLLRELVRIMSEDGQIVVDQVSTVARSLGR